MQTLTVCGGTLFDIACRYLGDAALWEDIATLNGIDDPWLSGLVTLALPVTSRRAHPTVKRWLALWAWALRAREW